MQVCRVIFGRRVNIAWGRRLAVIFVQFVLGEFCRFLVDRVRAVLLEFVLVFGESREFYPA